MSFRIICLCFFSLIASSVIGREIQKFDKAAFYAAMSSGNLEEVNKELDAISSSSASNKEGYEGALLMCKASLVKGAAEKLKCFKAGRIKFEAAVQSDTDNAEYRFLRFAIQEHAPKIVKYNKDLQADKLFIIKEYKNLAPVVQRAILDYTKKSKILNAQDLA